MLQIYNLFSKTPSNRRFSYIPVFPKELLKLKEFLRLLQADENKE